MSAELINEFEQLWESGDGPPDVFAFLSGHPGSNASEVVAVLLQDQRQRWQTDKPLKVENYLSRLPDLASDPDCKLQLAVGEFQARRNGDTSPSIDEFTFRFSDISDELRVKLSDLVSGKNRKDKIDLTTTQTYISDKTVGDQQIGRYRLVRVLGEGAFGRVYLGLDEELQRQVAIKVPTEERFQKPEDAQQYLEEARTVASLNHPNIVPVYDTGRTDDGSIYVVSKFIEGQTLEERIKQDRPCHDEAARLLATVAHALHHAHQRRLIHRDVKPGNILLEGTEATPYVADFGLAIREEDYLKDSKVAGTPSYMSPEQARGEGHRLDGRSDIFSLGVVFYELLTAKRPFRGSTANELLHQVISVDPPRPREVDNSIPAELERICLKALSKRASDRYATAAEFADDLLNWKHGPGQATTELQIVPRGLRSFDADDADFFLDLLPGPRNREGLPESIQFWKTRIEETDPDKTFSVGLIYGPSGCGKSSLVKAGLLPRLSEDVVAVYIEATPDQTETRILRGLRKQLPGLPNDLGLVETLTLLRRTEGRKVVIVLDQFEQWLHAHRADQETELVSALRQCDGGRLQAVVMVRDDFAMAAARFMDSLDIPILQSHNFATVDLFDVDHAEKVLTKFGQAFGKLPAQTSNLSDGEREFVGTVASGLAQDGKVVSVRLALFAEMVKGKSWIPATLDEVGGTEGIGVNFLEDTFSSRSANPKHRLHQQAAREVLKALLPEVGSDIKGHMRSHAELLEASGYKNRRADLSDLLRILDGELRLITPTDPEGLQTDSGSDPTSKYYQLTHDFLVPSLREWLTRKQRETRRGRAELRLAERSALWNVKPENRHLPNLLEWANIRCLTDKKQWSEPQCALMRKAARVQLATWGTAVAVMLLVGISIQRYAARVRHQSNVEKTESLVSSIQSAEGTAVPFVVKELEGLPRELVLRELRDRFVAANGQQKLSLAYGLAHFGEVEFERLLAGLSDTDTRSVEVMNIVAALQVRRDQALPRLRTAADSASKQRAWQIKLRLAIMAWHLGDTSIASEMLQAFPADPSSEANPVTAWDPIQRTMFIAAFPDWSGDLQRLAEYAADAAQTAHFRSGISLALGGVRQPSDAAKTAWMDFFSRWHLDAPDSGSHSAAGWALNQWELPPPTVGKTRRPIGGQDWWHTPMELTMVKIPVGKVQADDGPITDDGPIRIDKEFWLSDCEITVRLFWQFMNDDDYDGPKPAWDGPYEFAGLSAEEQLDHPVQGVNWYDAAMFCNWLSKQHELELCYEIEANPTEEREYKVNLIADATGFRLPTDAEWKFACRAMTTTEYSFGDDTEYLRGYGIYGTDQTGPVGRLRCNAWGLFDVHGNVHEWCWDLHDILDGILRGSYRVYRGGSWDSPARYSGSSIRSRGDPANRFRYKGFRVAAVPSSQLGKQDSGGAESESEQTDQAEAEP